MKKLVGNFIFYTYFLREVLSQVNRKRGFQPLFSRLRKTTSFNPSANLKLSFKYRTPSTYAKKKFFLLTRHAPLNYLTTVLHGSHAHEKCSSAISDYRSPNLALMFHLFPGMLVVIHEILWTSLTWEINYFQLLHILCLRVVRVFFVYCAEALPVYTLVFGFQLYILQPISLYTLADNIHTTFGQYDRSLWGWYNNTTTTAGYSLGLHLSWDAYIGLGCCVANA